MQFRDLQRQYEYLKPDIDRAISDVLISSKYISGPQVGELEEQLAEYVGVKHCVTCANGTDALTLALMAWGIGEGDAVFVPDFTFFSSGESPAVVGATPVFVDVEPDTFNMDPDALEADILRVREDGRYTPRVVIAVDLFGQPADYPRIRSICERYDLLLLEDGAQGFGGSIALDVSDITSSNLAGKRACSFGDISTTSFFPAKPLGCYGDGGAIFTDNDDWAALLRSYAVHGKGGENKYDNVRIGMNSRLDTLQAAILKVKLKAFAEHELDDVNRAAETYNRLLDADTFAIPVIQPGFTSSWAQYTIRLPESFDRDSIQASLKSRGIPTMVYYMKPMHSQRAFAGTYSAESMCPVTESLCTSVLSLPMGPYITDEEIREVAEAINQIQ